MFFDQFSYFLEDCDSLPAKTLRMGNFKFHFENVEKNTPSRTLRSSSDTRMLKIQQYKRKKRKKEKKKRRRRFSHLLFLWTSHLEFTPTRP